MTFSQVLTQTMNSHNPNSTRRLLFRLICVPKCAACKERLSPFARNDALDRGYPCLCDKCMEKWQKARLQMCHTCSRVAGECSCMPLKKTFVQPYIPSLFFYHPDQSKTESKIIYTLKHKNTRDLFEYISAELCPKVEELLGLLAISADGCVLTHVPRTKRSIVKNGFDQGELLCRAMSRRLGIACAPLLIREGGKEQKRLSRQERKQNSKRAIFANTELKGIKGGEKFKCLEEFLENKTVIIVEDLITTGATVDRAIKCLKERGAKAVLVCAVGRSELASQTKKQSSK